MDIFKTAVEVAGLETPKSHILDGVNIMPYLKGDKIGDPHEQLFWRKLEENAARIGDYKLILDLITDETKLFNIKKDLSEDNDLSSSNTKLSNSLKLKLKTFIDKNKPKTN